MAARMAKSRTGGRGTWGFRHAIAASTRLRRSVRESLAQGCKRMRGTRERVAHASFVEVAFGGHGAQVAIQIAEKVFPLRIRRLGGRLAQEPDLLEVDDPLAQFLEPDAAVSAGIDEERIAGRPQHVPRV